MDLQKIYLETQSVTGFCAVHRIVDTANELMGAGVEVEEGFCAHGFDIFNGGFELVGLEASGLRKAGAMLGADAESDIFSRMGAQASSACEGETNGTSGLFKDMGITLGAERAFQEIHGRAAEKAGEEEIGRLVVNLKRRGHLRRAGVVRWRGPWVSSQDNP